MKYLISLMFLLILVLFWLVQGKEDSQVVSNIEERVFMLEDRVQDLEHK